MIHEAPIKLSKQYKNKLKLLFQTRKRAHYSYVIQNTKIVLNFWEFYLYVVIGLIGGLILFSSVVKHQQYDIQSELNIIYLSAIFFVISFQFSIKYFYHPADLIHFKHRKEIMLKLRQYAIIHAVQYHLISWAFLLTSFSPLYFYLTGKGILHLVCLLYFSVSFTLATSIIRKESKYHLRENDSFSYPVWYTLLSFAMSIWYITIFCFADYLYILVATCVNLFIFLYTYKWGNQIVMKYLSYLIDSDRRQNIIFATVVGLHPQYETKMKTSSREPILFKNNTWIARSNHPNAVLLEIILKRLLRTRSYLLCMLLFYIVFIIGLFIIKAPYQFFILSIVALYVSFLVHKQHVDYFYSYNLIRSYIEQGTNIKHIAVKITLLLNLPVILVMLVLFLLSC